MPSDHLFLPIPGSTQLQCKIHPLVIFSILDHHNRRNQGQFCVIGTLLGRFTKKGVQIQSAFGIPYFEGKELSVDMKYHKEMLALHQKTNPDEVVVGWYSSASIVDENSVTINNDYYKKEMDANPIHLTVDSEMYGNRMEIQPYLCESVGAGDEEQFAFYPVDYELDTSSTEQGCLSALMQTKDSENLVTPLCDADADGDVDVTSKSLEKLLSLLDTTSAYVDSVVEGDTPANNKIGRILAECVNSLPDLSSKEVEPLFDTQSQNKQAILQLAELATRQLEVAEQLQSSW